MRRRASRLRLVAAVAVVASTGSIVAVASPATAVARPKVLSASAAPSLPAGATVVGALAAPTPVHFAVTLTMRHQDALRTLLAGLRDPASPDFHRFLTPTQFATQFGATSAQLAAVETWLRSIGAVPTGVAGDRLIVHATAPASALSSGLQTSFARVRTAQGDGAFVNRTAPTVPAAMAHIVAGIVGLNTLPLAHSDLVRAPASRATRTVPRVVRPGVRGPKACRGANIAAQSFGSFTAPDLAAYYTMSPLYGLGDLGAGVKVGIAEFEPNATSDISQFQGCYHTSAAVSYTAIDNGVDGSGVITNDPGSGEAALDIENVIGIAPRATVGVYQTPNTDLGALDMYAQMVTDDVKVISTSWGSCEPETTQAVLDGEAVTFAAANAQGVAVFAASGDSGSTDCFGANIDNPPVPDSTLAVDDPASQPYVVGVGGTSATGKGEVVWDDPSGGASGGGISVAHCMPAYQDNPSVVGAINANSVPATALQCPSGPLYYRQVPDVSALADPSTGYTVYWSGGWTAIGGTSGSAPLWAAVTALVAASPYCKAFDSAPAVSPQSLYALAAVHSYAKSALFDVTKGNNAVAASTYTGSLYPARKGFDEASGLGTPSLTYFTGTAAPDLFHPGLASLLCYAARQTSVAPAVARVVPNRVASGHATTVTVVGTGFLAIAGANHVAIDGKVLPASCTTTRCRVTLPVVPPTTAHLRVLVQTYAKSPATASDLVTFVHAPAVNRLSPHTARATGSTRVTIRGHWFLGHVVVYFGGVRATHVRVVSSSRIVATAPRGAQSVYVTVSAEGGRSHKGAASLFRY